ncbi:leucine-rich repeat domain-containing protein [Treponema endosymbiont of Eucomonympha sp.]|uniref:leucine-rich repeat domain-containing protein n=1 Tax=Treponema endosymbiont of Eucomonympha sp. TaxID=1580831 RepID=UPI000782A686|nr:leucine-rich repeat domain-containing protein [Treponema endosymbiont of Eucomonympha sp.]
MSLVLPNSVTAIAKGTYTYGAATFASFTPLKTLEANGLKTVGGYAFYKCAALETASLPAAATVEGAAFQYCTALETVNLPLAATIEGSAFQYCDALESLTLGTALPALDTYVFRDAGRDSGGFTVYVPTAAAEAALNAAIEDTGNSWYKALKVPANMGEGKFNGVAVTQ